MLHVVFKGLTTRWSSKNRGFNVAKDEAFYTPMPLGEKFDDRDLWDDRHSWKRRQPG